MSAESSEPLIFYPVFSATTESLELQELRATKPSLYRRTLDAAAGFFEGNPAGPVGTILFWALGGILMLSGASLSIGSDGLGLQLQPWSLITAGVLFATPPIVLGLHSLSIKPGRAVYTRFRETMLPEVTERFTDWLGSNGLKLSDRALAGVYFRRADDLAFSMGLSEPITDGEIPFISENGERLLGSFELLPDGGYALLLVGVDERYERTSHA